MFRNIDKDLIKPYNFIMIMKCREIIEFLDKADKNRRYVAKNVLNHFFVTSTST